jgi:hypothetical protein
VTGYSFPVFARESGSRKRSPRSLQIAFALVVLAFFARFVGPALNGRLNVDDPMNIYYYWNRGPWELVRNLFLFFTTYQRPMGGVYFSLVYYFFGVNPLPYHIVITALLLLNAYLAYRFGRLLTGSQLAGGLVALITAYHAEMAQTVYLPAFVFDVLCFTFYFLALNYYLWIRSRGALLTKKQLAAFLALYVCALDSKEMAVSLPVIVLLYELINHTPSPAGIWKWTRREALPALISGAMTLAFILGKTYGKESLVHVFPEYTPAFTWDRYWESTVRFMKTFFYQLPNGTFFQPWRIALLAAILVYLAWRGRRKDLLLMSFFIWITPLPVTFVPGRGGALLSIPFVGWAVLLAAGFLAFCQAAARLPGARRLPAQVAIAVLVALGIAAFWAKTEAMNRRTLPGMRAAGELTENVFRQVKQVQPTVKPGAKIYVLKGPFADWDMKFIFELTYHDRSVNVWLADKTPLPPAEVAAMDYIFTWEEGKLIRVKPR